MPLKDLLQQVIQGSSYQRPDVLTDKAKRLARRAYVSPTPSRLQTNVRNLPQAQQQVILRPQAPKLRVNKFNQALNSGPGRLGLGALKGIDELNPVRGLLPGLAQAADASVNDASLQNSLWFTGGRLGTQLAGNALVYGKAFHAVKALPGVGARITKGLRALESAGGAKALAGKAIGAYAVGDPIIGAVRGGATALGQGQNILGGAARGVAEELTFPAQAAMNIPTAMKVISSKGASPQEKLQAGLGAGLSVLALLPVMPGLSDTKMAKVIPDQYKKYMDILRLADQKLKAAVPEKYYNRMSESATTNPVEYIRNLVDTKSMMSAIEDAVAKGKASFDDGVELYRLIDEDISKLENVTAPSGRFNPQIESLARVGDTKGARKYSPHQLALAKALDEGSTEPVYFGKLSDKKFVEINKRLADSGKKTLESPELYIHPNVLDKLKQKRIRDGKMSADQVADVAFSAIHNKRSRVLSTRQPQIKALVRPTDPQSANTAYVGEFGGSGSIKSVYPKELKKIQTESSGGRGVPPSGANRLNPAVPIPDIRDSMSIIPQNSATGTTPTIYKGLVPETLNAQKTSLPSTSGDSTENRLTRAQSAPQRISQTQDRQGFELDQSVTKSQRVGQSSKESISPISVNKETGRVENRYVTDARARIEEIDAQIANTRAELNAKKEVVATTRGMFSDETVRLINKIKGIAGRGRYAAGDVETLRNSKHARGVNDAVERVREATGIQGDDEAFEFIKNFPTKRTASDGKIAGLLEEKRALQEFISDANKQSGTFVQVRSKTNRAAERAINDFREWETQVFKQEGAITRKRLDKQLAGEIASMVRQNTKPAYLKNVEQLKDISNVGKGMTDVYRNVEHVFGKDSRVKREMLDPLDISRAALVDDLDLWGNKLQAEIVDSLGIKPNTKESAAVQQFGEKLRDYDSLVKEFGEKKAQNIKDADRWFRKQYDTLLSEVNTVRSKIYPNNPDKLIPRRNDYYRHFRDLSDTFAGLKNLFESSAGIDPSLSGVSEYVKPKSKWLSFAQQRLGMKTKYDAVGGFVDYVNAQSYAKHIDPHINKFRMLREELVSATSDKTKPGYGKLNNFIEFLDDYANDLAGKTNPADRALQKYIGRNPYRVLNWVNSRTKLNVILGNLSSAVAQFFNIPQGLAEAGPVNSARGGIRTLSSILSDDKAMAKSLFLKARYADDLATRFDTSIIGDAKRAAAWITSIGDEVGTKFIWNSLYEKGLKEGVDNPVKYADDLTRKMVAGRGIGEVPLLQKSKTFQLIAPFQLEVGNVWHVMREWAGEKAANKFVTFFVASYVMNRMAKNLRGSDVSFDPINAMIEAANTLEEEENTGRGAFMAAGRLLGEILSNAPLGQSIASIYPEYGAQIGDTRLPTREDFFGEGDPTRFGSGPLFVRGVTDPLAVVPPFGGQQLKRTYQGIQSWARGYDESASGKIRMPIEQSPINLIKSATFGKYSTKDARDYFNNDRSVLGEKQSETYKRIYKTQGPEAAKRYYDSIISKREGGGASGAFEGASGNAFSGGVIATGLQGTPKTKKGRAGRRPSLKSTPRLVITRPKAAPKFRVTRKPVSKVSGVSTKGLPKFRIVRA